MTILTGQGWVRSKVKLLAGTLRLVGHNLTTTPGKGSDVDSCLVWPLDHMAYMTPSLALNLGMYKSIDLMLKESYLQHLGYLYTQNKAMAPLHVATPTAQRELPNI